MTTVPTVAANELIESAWGNAVATVCNSELLRRDGGTMTGRLILANLNPTNNNEATRKLYVDNADQDVRDDMNSKLADKLAKMGGTMNAPAGGGTGIDMNGATLTGLPLPGGALWATRKSYVDDADAERLAKSGGTMTGDINMGTHQVINARATVDADGPNSLVTKGWVEANFQRKP